MTRLRPLPMLLTGLVLLLTSPPAAAQTSQSQTHKRPDPGGTCQFGQSDYGAYCSHDNGNFGLLGDNEFGVYGAYPDRSYGFLGSFNFGALGQNLNGNFGVLGGYSYGAYGKNANDGTWGRLGSSNYGVYGEHINDNIGGLGGNDYGAYGEHANGNFGYLGGLAAGVQGQYTNGNFGWLGSNNYAVRGFAANGYAGYFQGDVWITGDLTGGAAASKIDHPLDPEGRYLSHSFVESPDMMNVYNGNTVLDAQGQAMVELPSYFEVLNRDFRYQLTCIGGFAPVYIAEEIQGNRFKIAGGVPGMKVSWQVAGIRQDPWAEAHRVVVEAAKPVEERGYYLHPQLYGQPAERGVEWGRDPEGMQVLQELSQRREAERQQMDEERRQIDQEHEQSKTAREQGPPPSDNRR